MLFWQPPSFFAQWSRSPFVVGDVSHSCAEHFTIARKARLSRTATSRISLCPRQIRAHKRIGQDVRNVDNATCDRVRQDAVLAGTFAKVLQNPIMKKHFLSTGTTTLAEASLFDSVWGIGLRGDDPEASRCPGNNFSEKAISTVRDAIRASEPGLANPSPSHQFCTPTSSGGIHQIFPGAAPPYGSGPHLPGPSFGVIDPFF